jgi:DNA-binding NarL/FixJ family response regulator
MQSGHRRTIAVIDDDPLVLEATKRVLERAGHRVISRDRAPGSVALILREKPDLVLLDVDMPNVAGDRIADIICKSEPRGKTIVLLYSGLPMETLRMKAIAAGAHGAIEKTGSQKELVRLVNGWLARGVPSPSEVRLGQTELDNGLLRGRHPLGGPADGSHLVSLEGAAFSEMETERPPRQAGEQLIVAPSASAPPARTTSGVLRMETPTTLFVDDDPRMLLEYRRNLSRDDMLVEFTLYGEHAMRRILSDDPPDVIVSDLLMPDLNGFELYTRASAVDPSFSRRFVFVTGAASTERVARFLRSVPCRSLPKPVDFERLSKAIRYSAAESRVFVRSPKQQQG